MIISTTIETLSVIFDATIFYSHEKYESQIRVVDNLTCERNNHFIYYNLMPYNKCLFHYNSIWLCQFMWFVPVVCDLWYTSCLFDLPLLNFWSHIIYAKDCLKNTVTANDLSATVVIETAWGLNFNIWKVSHLHGNIGISNRFSFAVILVWKCSQPEMLHLRSLNGNEN